MNDRLRAPRPRCWLVLVLLAAPLPLFAQVAAGVGFRTIAVPDPVNGGSMPGYVFYPSSEGRDGVTWRGPYPLDATVDAPAVSGAKPLVVISHGQGGSALGHHDLASSLASNGFVVATFEHPKDNFHDQSGIGRSPVMIGRPIQVSAAVSALLEDPRWKTLIDADRIGVAGFSMGGYTSLLLVGAVPRFDRFIGYCERHPGDAATCDIVRGRTEEAGRTVEKTLGALQQDLTRWGATADPRIKAAFSMAPQSVIFDKAGLASVERPVFLYYGENDHVLLPSENARRIAPLLGTLAGIQKVPGADHWVFLAPCSDELARNAGDICSDPPGVNRAKEHVRINADALAFFGKTLASERR